MLHAFIQPSLDIPARQSDDPRIGHLIRRNKAVSADTKVVLIGFPSDEGVRRNWGRPGASKAPDYIRQQLFRMTPPATETLYAPFFDLLEHTVDVGNIQMEGDMDTSWDTFMQIVIVKSLIGMLTQMCAPSKTDAPIPAHHFVRPLNTILDDV